MRAAGGWARRVGPHPAKRWGCVSVRSHGLGLWRPWGFWPPGEDLPQQVDLVRGCTGAAWTMGGGPTGRGTVAGGVTGAHGLSSIVSPWSRKAKPLNVSLLPNKGSTGWRSLWGMWFELESQSLKQKG